LFPANSAPQLVSFICIITIIILVIVYAVVDDWFDWMISFKQKYSLNFKNNLTHNDGDLSMVVTKNGLDSSKIVFIHGAKNKTIMFSSPLSTQMGKTINFLVLDHGRDKVSLNMTEDNVTSVEASVENIKSGNYYGWLYFTNGSKFTIPIVVSTEPKVIQAMILVVIGVLLSIIFWEGFFYFNRKFNESTRNTRSKAVLNTMNNYSQLTAEQVIDVNADIAINRKSRRVTKLKKRYAENGIKIASSQVALVIFGMVTGLVGSMSNSYVTTSIEITSQVALTLIGIGLGIGSLKGLVDN
jgi:hypothetical protein